MRARIKTSPLAPGLLEARAWLPVWHKNLHALGHMFPFKGPAGALGTAGGEMVFGHRPGFGRGNWQVPTVTGAAPGSIQKAWEVLVLAPAPHSHCHPAP